MIKKEFVSSIVDSKEYYENNNESLQRSDYIDMNSSKTNINLVNKQQNSGKFSFLKNDRRSSAPGRLGDDFIPLSFNDNSSDNTKNNVKPLCFFDKAKINSTSSQINGNLINPKNVGTSSISNNIDKVQNLPGEKRSLNLLELEQMTKRDKKNRRKTIDAKTIISNSGAQSASHSSASLSSLQNMFKKKP
jgi:hypothetical protein